MPGFDLFTIGAALRRGPNRMVEAASTFREICAVAVDEDGVKFELDTVVAEEIRAGQEYDVLQGHDSAPVARAQPVGSGGRGSALVVIAGEDPCSRLGGISSMDILFW